MTDVLQWLLDSKEPWTCYRTLVDLLDLPEDDVEVQAARAAMVERIRKRTATASTAFT